MRRRALTAVGGVVAAAGAVFTLQGIGLLHGSSMSGVTTWAILGPIIALATLGVVATARGVR